MVCIQCQYDAHAHTRWLSKPHALSPAFVLIATVQCLIATVQCRVDRNWLQCLDWFWWGWGGVGVPGVGVV